VEVIISKVGAIAPGEEGTPYRAVRHLNNVFDGPTNHAPTTCIRATTFRHIARGSRCVTFNKAARTIAAGALPPDLDGYVSLPLRDGLITFELHAFAPNAILSSQIWWMVRPCGLKARKVAQLDTRYRAIGL